MTATVHNLTKERMKVDEGDVYIGRTGQGHSGYFGNPYQIGEYHPAVGNINRAKAIEMFEAHARERLTHDPDYRERVKALHGKRLFCFCSPKPCHGDVLAALADGLNEAQS